MTNPTSYTDEQVLSAIEALCSYETMCGFANILAGVFADRQRLQAEVRALRWVPLIPCHTEAPLQFNKKEALAWAMGFIDCCIRINDYRAKTNETKDAKS